MSTSTMNELELEQERLELLKKNSLIVSAG